MSVIKSPNPNFDGVSVGVQFTNGQGATDDAKKIEWFEAHGYTVEKGTESGVTFAEVNNTEFASDMAVYNSGEASEVSAAANHPAPSEHHEKSAKSKKH